MDNKLLEQQRQALQSDLDGQKTLEQRNLMGQFSTPFSFAIEVAAHVKGLLPRRSKLQFLDPAFGTGALFSALCEVFPLGRIESALGIEVDEHYAIPAKNLWRQSLLEYRIADFTSLPSPQKAQQRDLLICNPPYVRHHHITADKKALQQQAKQAANMSLSGLAGLYCYYLALAHPWMKKGGIGAWLLPSEFMHVNYGEGVRTYLLDEVTLIQIHRYDPAQVKFDDALVSTCVVFIKYQKPPIDHQIKFSYGGTLDQPQVQSQVAIDVLRDEHKWSRFPLNEARQAQRSAKLSDFFKVKRGIATGDNQFFVLTRAQIKEKELPLSQFRPILPSPRFLQQSQIEADKQGNPVIDPDYFVLDSKLPLEQIEQQYPTLFAYLKQGIDSGVSQRYLCRNRKVWYSQENRQPSPFYCTYIGRSNSEGKKPFRFILNQSQAIVANSYLILYPVAQLQRLLEQHPQLQASIFAALNSITLQDMLGEGRVYGGGMYKMEPKELANIAVPALANVLSVYQEDVA